MSVQPGGGADPQPPSELRLAVVFTGGVSLAIWMGGMAREINLLLAASRVRRGADVAEPGSAPSRVVRERYAALLDLLNLDCSLDILSGTSAGGINAAILGLANTRHLDFDGLRKLWFTQGSLSELLRDPSDRHSISLLQGDKGLLRGLQASLKELAVAGPRIPDPSDPTQVFVTTTLLTGQASQFTDDYHTLVRDTDHHGLFHFTGADLAAGDVTALALAARCSASFPAAFEPGLVPIGADAGDGYPDMAPFANTSRTQFAADGGLLANRPLGPALQAVFDRPADREVRRVLAYVVPSPGGPAAADHPGPGLTVADTPGFAPGLFAAMNALLAQTISADLAAIKAHNQRVRARDDARQELAAFGQPMERLAERSYATYRARRADDIARQASAEVLAQVTSGGRAADGRPAGFGADAGEVLAAAHAAAFGKLPAGLPAVGDYAAMNAAGRDALDDAKATVLAVVRRAFWLLSSAQDRRRLGELRNDTSVAVPRRPRPGAGAPIRTPVAAPAPAAGPTTQAAGSAAAAAAEALMDAGMTIDPPAQPWRQLAAVVVNVRQLLCRANPAASGGGNSPLAPGGMPHAVPTDPAGPADGDFVRVLLPYLAGLQGEHPLDTVATRLFDLHVARYVLQPDGLVADQALELVQMSADSRTTLDTRTLAAEKLTGLQLHHFGAFYKNSWRANDWMWGRLDGAGWLVHLLLEPRRLRRLADEAPDRTAFRADLMARLRGIAQDDPPPGVWDAFRTGAPAEMDFLTAEGSVTLPPSLPVTAMWVAAGLQRLIAAEELAHVAQQAELDAANGADEAAAQAFLAAYRSAADAGQDGIYPDVPVGQADRVLRACQVSAETFAGEAGSPLFTRTITGAAAVAVNIADIGGAMPSFLRPVLAGARTVTLLAYRATTFRPVARHPLPAGLSLIAGGTFASTSTSTIVGATGLASVLAGLLLVALGAARRIGVALASLALAAGGMLIAAGVIPVVGTHLFLARENRHTYPGHTPGPVGGRGRVSAHAAGVHHRRDPPAARSAFTGRCGGPRVPWQLEDRTVAPTFTRAGQGPSGASLSCGQTRR